MMKTLLSSSVIALLACIGCSGGNSSGDVEAARKASEAAPKSVAELSKDTPDNARASAAAGIAAGHAQDKISNDSARVNAMKMMNKQNGQ